MYSRIVVPLDGSELAELALPSVEELAMLLYVPLYLVRVLDLVGILRDDGIPTYDPDIDASAFQRAVLDEQDDSKRYLEPVDARLCDKGIIASGEVFRGSPANIIVAVSKPGDLIVVTTHGRGGLARFFPGSMAESVVRHAAVPVMIVRTAASARDSAATLGGETVSSLGRSN